MPVDAPRRTPGRLVRRSFTLVELLVAGIIAAFVLGSISLSLRQIGQAKNICKVRYDAFMRADAALNNLRRDIISVVRSDDLFYSRFLLIDNLQHGRSESYEHDELLMFTTRLRPLRNIDFSGEGLEYETHYRIELDRTGSVLWQRRDAFPDQAPAGGGMALPMVEGIIALSVQAYDGTAWFDDWDSDISGLPLAVRVTVVSSGHRGEADLYSAPRAILRAVIPIDRALSSRDWFTNSEEEDEAAEDAGMEGDLDGDGIPDDQQSPDQNGGVGRPGGPPDDGGGPPGPPPGAGGPDRPRPGRPGGPGPGSGPEPPRNPGNQPGPLNPSNTGGIQ